MSQHLPATTVSKAILFCALVSLLGACSKSDAPAQTTSRPPPIETTQLSSAPVKVTDAWLRPTVENQDATGGYFKLVSNQDLTLVAASSPLAEVIEIHEMKMDGDVMRMRALENLPIKTGEAVEFKPGGLHLMVMALNSPVAEGSEHVFMLQFQQANSARLEVPVTFKAKPRQAAGSH